MAGCGLAKSSWTDCGCGCELASEGLCFNEGDPFKKNCPGFEEHPERCR